MDCVSNYTRFRSSNPPDFEKVVKVDSNIFEVRLECLQLPKILSSGDPIRCSMCDSIMSSFTKIQALSDMKTFTCNFCETLNQVIIEENEIPSNPDQIYILEQVTQTDSGVSDQITTVKSLDSSCIIFCIDTSGSMDVKKRIDQSQWLKTTKATDKDGKVEVSRLECVQTAVESQLKVLEESFPMKKAGLVFFNSYVTIVGDGEETLVVDNNIQSDFAQLMNFAQSLTGRFLNHNIQQSYSELVKKVRELVPSGSTALGPALMISVILASEAGPGSKVVICTDGKANQGVGSLGKGHEQYEFYKEIGGIANQLGVTVSVISIEGADCNLEALNYVTSQTEGDVVKVDPECLMTQFSNTIKDEIIATEVFLQVNLHKSVRFYNQNPELLSNNDSTLKKFVGNATRFTAFSFQYILKTDQELLALNVDKSQLRSLHLQACISFRDKDGNKYLKVLNKVQDVLFDQEVVDENINVDLMMRAGRREAARLLEEGKIEEARLRSNQWISALGKEVKDNRGEDFERDMKIVEETALSYECDHRFTDTRIDFINRMKKNRD